MEKKHHIYSYIALALLMTLTACLQESPGGEILSETGNQIYFRSLLPSVTETRAGVVSKDNLTECQVTAFDPDGLSEPGAMEPYFHDKHFQQHADGHFLAEDSKNTIWPNSRNRLHFFAYYPSVETMKGNGDEDIFGLVNNSVKTEEETTFDYRIKDFRVARDIADQVDFIAAYSAASQPAGGVGTIDLNFSHQLARIEISAWSGSDRYDFEIAGVRIGNAITRGDFHFSSQIPQSSEPAWQNTENGNSVVEHIFSSGESIVTLSKESGSHSSADEAASIMGSAGPAMVIPMSEKIEAWEGKANPNIDDEVYTTDRLYLSVLLRVINKKGEIAYPYINNCDFIPVIYLAVGNDGKVIRRLYKKDDNYYTSEQADAEDLYLPFSSEEIRGFCWAALPITGGAKWEAGKIYTYKLNYTTGIGWHDPEDPTPGEPIIERGMVPFEVSVDEWIEAEGHNPNLDVPKR